MTQVEVAAAEVAAAVAVVVVVAQGGAVIKTFRQAYVLVLRLLGVWMDAGPGGLWLSALACVRHVSNVSLSHTYVTLHTYVS